MLWLWREDPTAAPSDIIWKNYFPLVVVLCNLSSYVSLGHIYEYDIVICGKIK